MTTEQSDDKDRERAGWFRGDRDSIPDDERFDEVPDAWGPIPRYAMLDIWMAIYGSETSQEFEAFADRHGYADTWSRLCAIVRETWDRLDNQTAHGHYTKMARAICAGGDHDSAVLWDRKAEEDKVRVHETTMAEEPIEQRLRRAWLNGYTQGFREGMERAAYIGQEWDHR